MPVDASLVGRAFPVGDPYVVTEEALAAFAEATGLTYRGTAPATFPIVLAFEAMFGFLDSERIDLFRIVHGDQKFSYVRPIAVGDELTTTLTVASLRQIGGNDIIGTTSAINDAGGALVCTTSATLVHRAGDAQ